jgi:DNA-binding NtrC family response regulator
MPASVLIVDDEKNTRDGLQLALQDDYDVYIARDGDEAFTQMDSQPFDAILTDLRMPGKSGLRVIDKALSLKHQPVVIMMTAHGNVEVAVEAMKRGAYDFLTKPVNLEKLEITLKRALKGRETERRVEVPERKPEFKVNIEGIIGTSPAMKASLEKLHLVAPSRASVLIEGETGTGKELIAHAIHQLSPRSKNTFMAVHCAALPSTLLESELFGHERGAFTGATERRIGRFEAADGGTLFLDEIGEINLSTQVKLLRFLESRTFERIGSLKPISVDVRLVAATNRDLEAMVRQGTFREDLLYRLNVVKLTLPPLRERQDDIIILIEHFAKEFARENNTRPPIFEPGALEVLRTYPWPGNVRELRNFVENTIVLNRSGRVTEFDLDPKFRAVISGLPALVAPGHVLAPTPPPTNSSTPSTAASGQLSVAENEKRLLREALIQARGNRTMAAKLMGISRRTLHRKLAEHPELDVKDRP